MFGIRTLVRIAGLLTFAAAAATASAQTYPSKPIKLIVPYATGGFSDALARQLAQKFTESMGQPVIVENKPGASTILGVSAAAKAPADGYTLLLTTGAMTINPHLFPKLLYDAERDFAPIGRIVDLPYVLVTHPSLPVNSFKEFLAYAKANPDKVNFGTPGNGTVPHLAMQLLEDAARISVHKVHYKGNGPALTDLVGGQINLLLDGLQQPLPFITSGKLKVLAAASLKRLPSLPDVPTIAETFPGFESGTWYQLLAPAGTPAPIIARLNAEIEKFTKDPALRDKLLSQGAIMHSSSPQELAAYSKAETKRWGEIISKAGIKLE
jgi:tripartite-type tricarboxylate transporter receptor subunit TctC